jgi:hypothetical protein
VGDCPRVTLRRLFLKFNIRILAVVAILAFATGALFIAACGDDDDNGASAQVEQSDFDALKEQVTRTSVLAAMTVFRVDALHEMDDDVSEATEIDAGWEGRVSRMLVATKSVEWPDDMSEKADLLIEKLTDLEAALTEESLDDAKTLTPEAHDAWHDLEHDTGPFIAGEEHEDGEDSHGTATEGAGH